MAQVPAIIYDVTINPDVEGYDFSNSIIIWMIETVCECCGALNGTIAAAWDFDVERCGHFFLPCGKYVSISDITAGIKARREIDSRGSALQ